MEPSLVAVHREALVILAREGGPGSGPRKGGGKGLKKKRYVPGFLRDRAQRAKDQVGFRKIDRARHRQDAKDYARARQPGSGGGYG